MTRLGHPNQYNSISQPGAKPSNRIVHPPGEASMKTLHYQDAEKRFKRERFDVNLEGPDDARQVHGVDRQSRRRRRPDGLRDHARPRDLASVDAVRRSQINVRALAPPLSVTCSRGRAAFESRLACRFASRRIADGLVGLHDHVQRVSHCTLRERRCRSFAHSLHTRLRVRRFAAAGGGTRRRASPQVIGAQWGVRDAMSAPRGIQPSCGT